MRHGLPPSRRLVIAGAAACLASGALAQGGWTPARPIKLISPFPPGGTSDLVARLMAQFLSEGLGQQVIVESRAGAGGTVGMDALVRSPPDGLTIGTILSTHAAAPALMPRLPYDAVNGVTPLALLTRVGLVLVTASSSPFNSLGDFIAAAKREPGKLTLASAGVGNANHLIIEVLKTAAGIDVEHVAYRGGGPALNDVMGGQVNGMFNPLPPTLPLISGNRLKPLVITSERRSKALPNVPTAAEANLPGIETYEWFGLAAPANLPGEITARYDREIRAVLARADMIARLEEQGLEVSFRGPQEFRAFFNEEVSKLGELIRSRNIRAE